MDFNSCTDTAAIWALAFSHPPSLRWNTQKIKKNPKKAGTVLSPLCPSAMTGWESHPDIFPLTLKLVRHVSCFRCCFSFPATDTVAQSERGGCACTNARWVGDILSFHFSLSSVCVLPQNHRGGPGKGRGEPREGGRHGGGQAAEVQIRRSYTVVLPSSTRLAQGWITGQQAGLHAAVALVTHSNEAWVSTDTS